MRYSLADYLLNIKTNDPALAAIFSELTVGGEGSYTDSISINLDSNLFETTGFATGGWVHDKNLSRTGTAALSLSQLAKSIGKFKQLVNMYYGGDFEGLTLTLTDSNANEIAKCEDCYIQKIPSQEFGSKAATQMWTFTCGKITFN